MISHPTLSKASDKAAATIRQRRDARAGRAGRVLIVALFFALQRTQLIVSGLRNVIPLKNRGITSYKYLIIKCVHCSGQKTAVNDAHNG